MSDRLYKRSAAVTLARGRVGEYQTAIPDNAIIITDLRVQFAIEKSLKGEPNTCDITISNLSAQTRAEFSSKPLYVILEVGYDDNPLKRLFAGDVIWAPSTRRPPDWETLIQAGDGTRASVHARLNRSYRSGINKKTILKDLASAMGMTIPTSIAEARALQDQFVSGVTVSGQSSVEMDRLLKSAGMEYSIQGGELQIVETGGVTQDRAWFMSADDGMIGTPVLSVPTESNKTPTLTVQSLIFPELTPGGKLELISESLSGTYRITRVTHAGDTHGDTWLTTVEGKPL